MHYCQDCGAGNAEDAALCFACGHALGGQQPEDDAELLLLGRYHVLRQIGSGGFGAVYRAVDTQAQGRIVAIKSINLKGLTPTEIIEATDGFNREQRLLSALNHQHLPRIYDHFTDPDHWYLVMQFIEGVTLEHYLKDSNTSTTSTRRLPLNEVLDIALQLCDVLQYLHTQTPPIIYRDLKPSNIICSLRGQLYLIDFGIARYYKEGKRKDTIPLGSPGYAAPEQYGKAQTTPRADIYSLGVLLHQLLSGDDPSEAGFQLAPLRIYGEAGCSELVELISSMIAHDPAQRPEDMHTISTKLQEIQQLRPEPAFPSYASTPLWQPGAQQQYGTQSAGQQMQHMQQSYNPAYYVPQQAQKRLQHAKQAQQKKKTALNRRRFIIAGIGALIATTRLLAFIEDQTNAQHIYSEPPAAHPQLTSDQLLVASAWSPTRIPTSTNQVSVLSIDTTQSQSYQDIQFVSADVAGNVIFWDSNYYAQYNVPIGEPIRSMDWDKIQGYLLVATEAKVYMIWLQNLNNGNNPLSAQTMFKPGPTINSISAAFVNNNTGGFLLVDRNGTVTNFTPGQNSTPGQSSADFQYHTFEPQSHMPSAFGAGNRVNATLNETRNIIVTATSERDISAWDIATEQVINTLTLPAPMTHVSAMCTLTNGQIAIGSTDGQLLFWDISSNTKWTKILPAGTQVNSLSGAIQNSCVVATNNGIFLCDLVNKEQQPTRLMVPNNKSQYISSLDVRLPGDGTPPVLLATTSQQFIQLWES